MEQATARIRAEGFRRVADEIEARPGGYDQTMSFWPVREDEARKPGEEECGSACCVMGHAALLAGSAHGFTPEETAKDQLALACGELGLEAGGAEEKALFARAWPVAWFVRSGAASRKTLLEGERARWRDHEGRMQHAEPRSGEAVVVLRWMAELGYVPPAV